MKKFIAFKEALELTLSNVTCGEIEILPLSRLLGTVLAEDVISRVDCPSVTTSRKDGYAVFANDLARASKQNSVSLSVQGNLTAGDRRQLTIKPGQTVRVTTGAPLPEGADAVLSEEFCRREENTIIAYNTAEAGRNIHARGRDIRLGEIVAETNRKLTPALIGLLAAAGLDEAPVYKSPRVAVIATGDEVVLPGEPLDKGKLYASNMVELCAWLSMMGLDYTVERVSDNAADLKHVIEKNLSAVDVFLTSGGAWGSERDLIIDVAQSLNWMGIYHRVRMGPGKPVAFGLLDKKPLFCLPGGPPSNEMAFLQLAVPALLKIKGDHPVFFPVAPAVLSETVEGKYGWTDFIHARLEHRRNQRLVHPARLRSSLQSMAQKEALIIIPEDCQKIYAGDTVNTQLLVPSVQIPRPELKGHAG